MIYILFAQSVSTIPDNVWGFLALAVLTAASVYQIYIANNREERAEERDRLANEARAKQQTTIDETKKGIEEVSEKTDGVHSALNSQLDAFKKEAAEQYKLSLQQAIDNIKLEGEKALSEMKAHVTILESKLEAEREKAVTLAASKPADPIFKDYHEVHPGVKEG